VRYVLNRPTDAHEAFHPVVIGGEIFIGYGPIVAIAVVVDSSKIEVTETFGMTTPV
jgi:hypothetical protein